MKQNMQDLTEGSLGKKILIFSVPLMLSNLLQVLFNMADIAVIGQFAGSLSLGAVGSTATLVTMFTGFLIGLSGGINVLTALYYGAKDRESLSKTIHSAALVSLIMGVLLLVLGVGLSEWMLTMLKTREELLDKAVLYLRIYYLGMPALAIYNFGNAVYSAVGNTKKPLYYLGFSGVLNIILNLFFVIICHLSVAVVGIGTVISQLISCILVLRCLYQTEGSYQLRFSKLSIKGEYLKQIFQVGLPAGIQSTVINFSNVLLQSSVNSFGSIAMAGYTAANNIFGFLYVSVNSVTQACMSFTSQNYGVRKPKRMDRVLVDCLILSFVVSFAMGCGAYFFGPQLLKIYTEDPEVIQCGMEILAYTTVTYFLCGQMDLFPGALRGMGRSGVPMILSIIGTVGLRIVWIFGIFPAHRSLKVLFISYPASWILTIIMQVTCFWFVRRKVHRQLLGENAE